MKTLGNFLDFCCKHDGFTALIIFLFVATVMITGLSYGTNNKVEDFSETSSVNYTTVEIKGSSKTDNYLQEVVTMVKIETARQGDNFLEKEGEIAQNVMKAFNEKHSDNKKAQLLSLAITFQPSPEDLAIAQELRSIEKRIRLEEARLQRDKLISEAAKRDAEGYTSTAERLEDRRDNRRNSTKSLELQEKQIESNERIQKRKSEAVEKAADNVGYGRSATIVH